MIKKLKLDKALKELPPPAGLLFARGKLNRKQAKRLKGDWERLYKGKEIKEE